MAQAAEKVQHSRVEFAAGWSMNLRADPRRRTRGTLMLVAEAFDHLSARIHEFHRAISDIPFASLNRIPAINRGSNATRTVHDGITDGVYHAIRGTARVLFTAADSTLRALEKNAPLAALPAPATIATQRKLQTRDHVISALSGLVGDQMAHRRNPLAIRFGVYRDGVSVRTDVAGLLAAYPNATPRIAVFVHGLCSSENVWDFYQQPGDPLSEPYDARLSRDLGYTPVRVRYNSGLHISLNGRSLARLLDRLQAHWPVPLQEIVLIGHSMGGLVSRSAAEVGAARGATWMPSLQQVICLGSPHLGAPLERVVHVGTHFMKRVPLSAPLAKFLDSRSLGIKDLRWGYTRDVEHKRRDPDAFWTQDRLQNAPVPGVRYRFLGTSLTRDPKHPLSRAFGDGLVPVPSSLACDIAGADSAFAGGIDHMRVLNHPQVYTQLLAWLTAAH